MAKKKIPSGIEITELMLVIAGNDYSRTFMAEIYREITIEGKSIVRGNLVFSQGILWSASETQEELRRFLNDMITMDLDYGLLLKKGVTIKLHETDCYLN